MVGIALAALREIGRRVEAGKGLKVLDEMCLIVVAASQSDIHPLDTLLFPEATQNFLKALDATELLGRQPDFVAAVSEYK